MRTGVALLCAAGLLLAACSTEDTTETITQSTAPQTVDDVRIASGSFTVGSPVPEVAPSPQGIPATTTPPGPFGISDVRMDRGGVVFTFFGDGVVNYVGHYVDAAVTYGDNATLDVPGTSILQLDLISSPSPEPGSTVRPTVLDSMHTGVESFQTAEPSSGVTQAFIGTSADRPNFTVTSQQDPPTLTVAVS
ncbi:hypothetical protein QMK17_18125 [Rhodococcus sp. G-MC3]|uniref:AMIN-like domain-containing (lipo)protein n=1 Tax=Rhodococcus sp. G-MC3 TaxID=3046209 RepID=UPI0024B9759E|nr:hypothetical protein [Rhodococcus sp. G-MC3]MDJ0395247.1 hypothetical protein [Rhodococcus sp. G-MC3]